MKQHRETAQRQTQSDLYSRDQKILEASFQEGFTKGRRAEQRHQQENQRSSIAVGLIYLLSTLLAVGVGVGLGTFLLFLNKNQSIPLPTPSVSPEVNAQPKQETTIIERSIEKVKDVVPSTGPKVDMPQQSPDQSVPQSVPTPAAPSTVQSTPEMEPNPALSTISPQPTATTPSGNQP
jgi:hypothetical protein